MTPPRLCGFPRFLFPNFAFFHATRTDLARIIELSPSHTGGYDNLQQVTKSPATSPAVVAGGLGEVFDHVQKPGCDQTGRSWS